MEAYLN